MINIDLGTVPTTMSIFVDAGSIAVHLMVNFPEGTNKPLVLTGSLILRDCFLGVDELPMCESKTVGYRPNLFNFLV